MRRDVDSPEFYSQQRTRSIKRMQCFSRGGTTEQRCIKLDRGRSAARTIGTGCSLSVCTMPVMASLPPQQVSHRIRRSAKNWRSMQGSLFTGHGTSPHAFLELARLIQLVVITENIENA